MNEDEFMTDEDIGDDPEYREWIEQSTQHQDDEEIV